MTVVRFAPSPTGRLHIGNVRAALFNWLYARQTGGRFLLRLDDTDTERSRAEYAAAIEEDLAWLGLGWDLFARQSDRVADYNAAAERLKAAGRLYPAYETEEELERRRRFQLASGRPPIYDRAALRLSAAERAKLEAEGRRPHWRFKLDGRQVTWTDLVRGAQHIDTASLSDPVLIREDGTFLYTLPSVVDDIAFAITHVIRGEDHVTNTGAQIEIFEALGARPPAFAHYSLLVGADGAKLSKRLDSLSIGSLKASEVEPLAVIAFLAKLGTSDPVEAVGDAGPLIASFAFEKIGRAPARFDEAELQALSARVLHVMPYEKAADRLNSLGVGGGEAFWLAVRPNLSRLAEAQAWWAIVSASMTPPAGEEAFRAEAAALLPGEPWSGETWGEWTSRLKDKTGRKGKELFQPLRRALTGEDHGPDMKSLLPLIGRERALQRLGGLTA